jgi:hypothetical protein
MLEGMAGDQAPPGPAIFQVIAELTVPGERHGPLGRKCLLSLAVPGVISYLLE